MTGLVYLAEQFLNGDTGAPLNLWLLPLVLPGLCLAINQAGKCSLIGGSDLFSQSYLSTKTYSSRMMKTNTRQAHIQTSSNVKHHGTEFKCLSQSDGSFALFQLSMFQIYLFQNFSQIPSKHLEAFKIVEGIVGRTKLMNGL